MQTLTKVYERHDVARQVVNELEVANFPSSSITFLANKGVSDQYVDKEDATEAGAGAGVGAAVGGAAGMLTGLGLLTIPGLDPWWRQVGLPLRPLEPSLAALRVALRVP